MNEAWPRWIQASITKYIKAAITTLPVYGDRDHQPGEQVPEKIEFAIVGPSVSEPTGNDTVLTVLVTVLGSAVKNDSDAYNLERVQGKAQLAVPGCIPVYKYGNDAGDDDTQLGILVRQDPVTPLGIGHQEKSNRLRQIGLIANYRMDL